MTDAMGFVSLLCVGLNSNEGRTGNESQEVEPHVVGCGQAKVFW